MRAWRVVVVTWVASSWAMAGAEPDEPPNVADVAAVVEAHNKERAEMKLPPVTANPKLEAAALAHARDMAQHDKMTHEGSDGSTPAQRIERKEYYGRGTGENVAAGQSTVSEVMRTWINSPPHKKNILGDFSEIGAACVKAEDGTPYWCVDFGLSWPVLDPDKAAASVVEGLNRERSKAKKPRLKTNLKLTAVAKRFARTMAAQNKFVIEDDEGMTPFQRLDKVGYRFRRVGESTASGQPTPEEAVKNWLEEAKNRESLLGDFTEIGVGYATAEKGTPYWCFLFGRPAR